MKIRTRLILALLLLVGTGFLGLVHWIIDDLRPRYLAAMEESMIDTATIFSSQLENRLDGEKIDVQELRRLFTLAEGRRFSAKIYEETKNRLDLRVYVTDRQGIVLFDSDNGRDEGKNYSKWIDVILTLRGEYGARTTPEVRGDPTTSILYVGAPVSYKGKIIGVVTVCKRARNATRFLIWARKRIIVAGVMAALFIALLGIVIYFWITIPLEKLMGYARAVSGGQRTTLPALGRNEIGELGAAFEEMRDALEGKEYISQYVQTLTHEMKSPLSAIRGAAELLEEDMPPDTRRKFLENIRGESTRIQDLIDRMLQLSALEKRKGLRDVERIDLNGLLHQIIECLDPLSSAKRLVIKIAEIGPLTIEGEYFLVRQALLNVVQNAVDFSPPESAIDIRMAAKEGLVEITVADEGPGIPDYALDKIFDRFYSLTRPDTGKKSSGLGLTITREAVALHGGSVHIENGEKRGARAVLRLPNKPSCG